MIWQKIRKVLDPTGSGQMGVIIPNILRSALEPAKARVMAKKLYRRWHDQAGLLTNVQNLRWIEANVQDFSQLAREINPQLWEEAQGFQSRLAERARLILGEPKVASSGLLTAGGAFYPFLHFVTRHLAPEYIVETGVAAGYSSEAFLDALEKNGQGRLFSTDFPLFRGSDPEGSIGVLVEERLKSLWELHADGDEAALPRIVRRTPCIDIFHYDSDKSYYGRAFAVSTIQPRLHARSLLVMDDIGDNSFFHDYVQREQPASFSVFQFLNKYIGVVGSLQG
jgi:predicted O-methyltransferase YrrM